MARRPVFVCSRIFPYVDQVDVDFAFYSGFSLVQKQRSIESLHQAYRHLRPNKSVLEISSRSADQLGVQLSAFQLMIHHQDVQFSVESAFQSSKRFEKGGPYRDLLKASAREAKRDVRLRESGNLVDFQFFGQTFPLIPRTYFYDWIYINALMQNQNLLDGLEAYDAFTDIEFNPARSLNCQARSIALFQGMKLAGVLDEALSSRDAFLHIAYRTEESNEESIPLMSISREEQQPLF